VGFSALIPARLGSSRLPGKPLLDIAGKVMVRHVFERAQQSNAESTWVITDHPDIIVAVEAFGGSALMTSAEHTSGTLRLAEAAHLLSLPDDHIVVNVQGDEPSSLCRRLIDWLKCSSVQAQIWRRSPHP